MNGLSASIQQFIESIKYANLGLAIVKAYVEMLGGSIKVKSRVSEVSEFSFTIPCQ